MKNLNVDIIVFSNLEEVTKYLSISKLLYLLVIVSNQVEEELISKMNFSDKILDVFVFCKKFNPEQQSKMQDEAPKFVIGFESLYVTLKKSIIFHERRYKNLTSFILKAGSDRDR